jgi:cyclophilin family peptidyl-prolyl cis-trans isomerase
MIVKTLQKVALLLIVFSLTATASTQVVNPVVVLETSLGQIELNLDEKQAPLTVKNFLQYVDSGHYNGTIFHRVIDNFMIQGGGFNGKLEKVSSNAPIQNEAHNGLQNDNFTIAMARTNDPHSATAQFFINVKDNSFLNHRGKNNQDYGYAVFGKVTKGGSVINRIKKSATTQNGRFANLPTENIIIKKAYRKDKKQKKQL